MAFGALLGLESGINYAATGRDDHPGQVPIWGLTVVQYWYRLQPLLQLVPFELSLSIPRTSKN